MDLITIIVPVYNAKKYIKKCVNSILNQTYENLEIILVDDGSNDGSSDILDSLKNTDDRVKVIHQHNQGSVIARKNGIKEISKDSVYFCFCDADDLLPKDSIEKLYKAIVKDDSDICTGFTCRLFRSLKIPQSFVPNVFKQEYQIYDQNSFINELYCSWFGISNVPVNLVAKLYKTEMFKSIMLEVPNVVHFFGEDLIQTLNCFPKANKTAYINDVVYYYRVGGGTSKFQPLMIEDWISLYNYKKDFSEKYPMPQDIEYLMNIELCNMVFTYFEMLVKFKKK